MTDRLELIQELLQENRDEQRKGNALLGELRVDVAALQRSHDGHGQNIADMRAEIRQVSDRLRAAELQLQPLTSLEARHNALEGRVRVLEGDGREARIVTRSAGAVAREVMRYAIGAIGALLVTAAVWAAKHGWAPD